MANRLVRAKHKIRNAGIRYRVPPAHLLPERTAGMQAVLSLLFNEGYTADAERRYLATPKPPKPGHRQTRSPQPPFAGK